MKKLWLDDLRPVPDDSWDLAVNFDDFKSYIREYGVPELISFDHDLGPGKTGYDCAKWLVDQHLAINEFEVHSMNPVGRDNIINLLTWWKNIYGKRIKK